MFLFKKKVVCLPRGCHKKVCFVWACIVVGVNLGVFPPPIISIIGGDAKIRNAKDAKRIHFQEHDRQKPPAILCGGKFGREIFCLHHRITCKCIHIINTHLSHTFSCARSPQRFSVEIMCANQLSKFFLKPMQVVCSKNLRECWCGRHA